MDEHSVLRELTNLPIPTLALTEKDATLTNSTLEIIEK
jgi:hypothetical protein